MFVPKGKNKEWALNFWSGQPSGKLLWAIDADNIDAVGESRGYNRVEDFFFRELGVLIWAWIFNPAVVSNPSVEIVEIRDGDRLRREYRHRAGVLCERLVERQIVECKVKTPDDLAILRAMWEGLTVAPRNNAQWVRDRYGTEMPLVAGPVGASAVQQMLQYEAGVENFWFLAMDCPDLLEEAMALYQDMMRRQYAIMQQAECDGFAQSENTSTTMISPAFYERWSVPQLREYTAAAHARGKRAMVHMCGLLKGLMPYCASAGIDIIHALTSPPLGDLTFGEAFQSMPPAFGMLGRFGAPEWIGKAQAQIERNLERLLPHRLYRERAFVLLVTADGADYSADDLFRVRDAVQAYEDSGA